MIFSPSSFQFPYTLHLPLIGNCCDNHSAPMRNIIRPNSGRETQLTPGNVFQETHKSVLRAILQNKRKRILHINKEDQFLSETSRDLYSTTLLPMAVQLLEWLCQPWEGGKSNKGQGEETVEPLTAAYSFYPEVLVLLGREAAELFAVCN